MPNYGVQKSSIHAVCSWYASQPETKFTIYRGNKVNDAYLTGGYYGIDKEEGQAVLESTLNEIESNDFNIYFLKLMPSNAKSKQAAPGVTFQLFTPQQGAGYAVSGYGNSQVMTEVLNEIRALRAERLAELQKDDDDDNDEPEQTQNDFLAGFINNPQMQSMLMGILANVFTSNKPQPIAGIESSADELHTVVSKLLEKGATLDDLKKLAEMNQAQFTMLLGMLRK